MLQLGKRTLQTSWTAWEQFWFEADAAVPIRLFRRSLGALLFLFYSIRTLDLGLFYGELGVMPVEVLPTVIDMDGRFSVLFWLNSPASLWALHGLFLLSLAALALGVRTRFAAWIAFLLHVSFMNRNLVVSYGIDQISTFFLFALCFSTPKGSSIFDSVALRLIQIQVCIIYAYSGVEKLRGPSWWEGDAVWLALANPQVARTDFSALAQYPGWIALLSWSSVLWEVYFPALVWFKRLRLPALAFGVMMHLGIGLTLRIPFFALLLIVSYLAFLTPSELRSANNALRQRFFRK
jgi:hypothetical protein